MKQDAPRMLVEGTRDHFSTKDDGKSKHKQVLSDNERSAIEWLVGSYVDYPLEAKTDCPHQSNDRYVMCNYKSYLTTEYFISYYFFFSVLTAQLL